MLKFHTLYSKNINILPPYNLTKQNICHILFQPIIILVKYVNKKIVFVKIKLC